MIYMIQSIIILIEISVTFILLIIIIPIYLKKGIYYYSSIVF